MTKFTKYSKYYKKRINAVIESILERKIKASNNPFLTNYYQEISLYLLAGGKRIRPLLCIATYNAFTSEKEHNIILPSVAVEFLHNASLMHDDIIDHDNFRRGNPSFHYKFQNYYDNYSLKKMNRIDFGNSVGIIGGDSTFFLGLEPLLYNNFDIHLNFEAVKLYKQAFIEIADGVLIETDFVNRKVPNMDDYLLMVSLKTGALLEKSLLIGAIYAKASDDQMELLSKFGINLGIVFQIIDDILGTFGNEKITGKPIDGDIKEGKRTCLLIEALKSLDMGEKVRLSQLIEKTNITDDDVKEIRELYNKANVVEKSKELAEKYYEEALSSLNLLSPDMNNDEVEFFNDLLDFVYKRNF